MRVVSWNMAYWKPGHFKTQVNRQRQWALLMALAPDVALLQECRPDDLAACAPGWGQSEYELVGAIPPRWTACTVILARRSLGPKRLDASELPESEQRWLKYLSGYLAAATIDINGAEIRLASVHSIAKEVSDIAVTDDDHALV